MRPIPAGRGGRGGEDFRPHASPSTAPPSISAPPRGWASWTAKARFWAMPSISARARCRSSGLAVTPQAALMASKPPFAITHAPGYMFITDIPETHWQV